MQGRLRNDHLSVTVETECGHCRQPLRLSIDSELNFEVLEGNPKPLVYAPMIMDLRRLDEPSIIDKF